MVLQQILKAITKGWKTILIFMLIAAAVSLYISISTTPRYRSQATFLIAPNRDLASSRDIVSAFTALDTLKIFSTYTDILISERVYNEAVNSGSLADINLKEYSRKTEMNPESIILALTVEGPNPQIAALLANEIGKYGIQFINAYYSVFEIGFLDQALPAPAPFIPQTYKNFALAAGVGFLTGLAFIVVRELTSAPMDFFMRKILLDSESSSFSKRYLEKLLLTLKGKDNSWPIAFLLIKLKGLEDIFRILPGYSRRKIMTEAVRRLKEQLKGNDLVGRWDKFTIAVVLGKTPAQVVGVIENRLKQSLQAPVLFGVDDADKVELSPIVVSQVSENSEDFETFIEKAEETMRDLEW